MGWSSHHPVGLIHYDPQHSYRGYTLINNSRSGFYTNLIDMEGRVCHRWETPDGIGYPVLLPSGNLLLRTHPPKDGGGAEMMGGSSGALLELDWEGNVVWEHRNPLLHHDFKRLPNGNTLTLLWERIPAELTARVQGGYTTEEDHEQMFGDVVEEITPDGQAVQQWQIWKHLDVEQDVICPLEGRREWSHCNSVNLTPAGDLLVSFRQLGTIGIIDRNTGDFTWKWGPGEVSHQHHPTHLDNGRILLFDNGSHRRGPEYSRVIEVDPGNQRDRLGIHRRASPVVL